VEDEVAVFYLGFVGGGFGTPVVSYAPLPMLHDCTSEVTILNEYEVYRKHFELADVML
jgi:hypothetical protein